MVVDTRACISMFVYVLCSVCRSAILKYNPQNSATATYNVVCDRSLRTRKYHIIRQNSRGKSDRSIALYDFHDMFFHGVVKLLFSNKCFSDRWLPCASINMISKHNWCERGGDGSLLRDSAQAFSNVFFSKSKRAFLSNLLMSLQLCNIRFRQVFC